MVPVGGPLGPVHLECHLTLRAEDGAVALQRPAHAVGELEDDVGVVEDVGHLAVVDLVQVVHVLAARAVDLERARADRQVHQVEEVAALLDEGAAGVAAEPVPVADLLVIHFAMTAAVALALEPNETGDLVALSAIGGIELFEMDLEIALKNDKDDIGRMLIKKLKPLTGIQADRRRHIDRLSDDIKQLRDKIEQQQLQYEQLQQKATQYFHHVEQNRWEDFPPADLPGFAAHDLSAEEIELELLQRKEDIKGGKTS